MLAMIDNYDSFTYNLVQYFGELGEDVRVFRNDEVTIADLEALKPDFLCVSPGPSVPSNAGISEEAIPALCPGSSRFSVCASDIRRSVKCSAERLSLPVR